MPIVFISYRRSDTQMVAGRLREALARHFGESAIFRDKNSIGAGEDWTKAIKAELTHDTVVIALIGPTWAAAKDDDGRRRLDDPADWNRVELEEALQRSCRIVPLLVDETKMPKETELPESLRPIARTNALKLRDDDWDSDIERLIHALDPRSAARRMGRAAATAAVALVASAAAGYAWFATRGGATADTGRSEGCLPGFVWRETAPNDRTCVTPETRAQAARDNAQAAARRNPAGGAYGPDTCLVGYVWREATPDDRVCVPPQTRTETASDNGQATARRSTAKRAD
jgi:TIR domain-containing protein